ncbi:hypothetical protein AgCh_037858 [Apium graveolens]
MGWFCKVLGNFRFLGQVKHEMSQAQLRIDVFFLVDSKCSINVLPWPPWSRFRSQRLQFSVNNPFSVFDLFEVETKANKIDKGMRIGWFEEVGCWFRGQVKRNMSFWVNHSETVTLTNPLLEFHVMSLPHRGAGGNAGHHVTDYGFDSTIRVDLRQAPLVCAMEVASLGDGPS